MSNTIWKLFWILSWFSLALYNYCLYLTDPVKIEYLKNFEAHKANCTYNRELKIVEAPFSPGCQVDAPCYKKVETCVVEVNSTRYYNNGILNRECSGTYECSWDGISVPELYSPKYSPKVIFFNFFLMFWTAPFCVFGLEIKI